jgi:hypothetical protein
MNIEYIGPTHFNYIRWLSSEITEKLSNTTQDFGFSLRN